MMSDMLKDVLLDTIKLLPYLFIAFIILEFIEHNLSKKNVSILTKNKKYGPIVGGVLGALPQCGFGTVAANLFSSKVISIGTVIAVFLSTSDEMLPIMIGEKIAIIDIIKIISFKVLVGIITGFLVDLFYNKKSKDNFVIEHMCEEEHCHCNSDGVIISSIKHTIKIGLFILIANLLISLFIYEIGEENLQNVLLHHNIFTYFIASLIGLIPNCASSVIITELYLNNLITLGNLMAGLLTGSGLGILVLFKSNRDIKENIIILSIIYFVGVLIGIIVDFVI